MKIQNTSDLHVMIMKVINGSRMLSDSSQSVPKPPWCLQPPPILTNLVAPLGRDAFSPLALHDPVV